MGGVPISPTPLGSSVLGRISTIISGMSAKTQHAVAVVVTFSNGSAGLQRQLLIKCCTQAKADSPLDLCANDVRGDGDAAIHRTPDAGEMRYAIAVFDFGDLRHIVRSEQRASC